MDCNDPTLSAREIELTLALGNASEHAYAQEQLRCTSDREALATAIAWYLDRGDYETALCRVFCTKSHVSAGGQWPEDEPSYGVQMSLTTPLLSWRD